MSIEAYLFIIASLSTFLTIWTVCTSDCMRRRYNIPYTNAILEYPIIYPPRENV